MMIIEAKFREITWEEYLAHLTPGGQAIVRRNPKLWFYGTGPLRIEVPAIKICNRTVICDGPFFRVVEPYSEIDGQITVVCPHVAVIGD
jgi:hypothetical protein